MHHRCVRQREQLLDHLFGSVPWLHRSPTHDLPGARVAPENAPGAAELFWITLLLKARTRFSMNEDRPHFVVGAGVRAGLGSPAAKRRVGHQRDFLARSAEPEAATKRAAPVMVDDKGRPTASVVALAQLLKNPGLDRSDLKGRCHTVQA
jgi:hypothetical protein